MNDGTSVERFSVAPAAIFTPDIVLTFVFDESYDVIVSCALCVDVLVMVAASKPSPLKLRTR